MSKTVLIIAAHPDDEILGCGGTMAKHVSQYDKVHVVILAEGLTSRDTVRSRELRAEELSELGKAAYKANQVIGVTSLVLYHYPDNRMDSIDRLDVTKTIELFIKQYKPDIVYTHHIGDVNIDHRCIHEAVITACRPIPGNHIVKDILFFEVASSTEWQTAGSAFPFTPNYFVDISSTIDIKLKSLEEYESEMREWPHSRSIRALEHLARWRGASIGTDAAESFMVGRSIK
ncbi:PIG-L deacetylase family protein [Paenibacillus ferrarius]|uniref:PIG-L deacetylase family protein n=1 Tax=Paenibacillus ferrarius TaxID=1469647 RepID=UPI003D2AC40D